MKYLDYVAIIFDTNLRNEDLDSWHLEETAI